MLESPLLIPCLLGALAVLQLFVLFVLLRLSSRVSRLFSLIASPVSPGAKELSDRREANSDQKKWFEAFLAEEPARRQLPKKEQFAAFRRWREEKGMNWKAPAG